MLTLLLVWTVALGSLAIFVAGMIFPELSRKNDLIWVGIGLFYALILWANAGNMGGGLVLGQTAGVSMMVWLGIQTMTQRRELTSEDKKTPVPDWLQKIVDFVVPLWDKAYGAIAGQLGLETESQTDTTDTESGSGGFDEIKAKVLGFLDKLNTTPSAPEPEIAADSDELDEDWDDDDEDSPEMTEEVEQEVVAEEEQEEVVEATEETSTEETIAEEAPEVVAEDTPVEEVVEEEPVAVVEEVVEATPEPEVIESQSEHEASTQEEVDPEPEVIAEDTPETVAEVPAEEPAPVSDVAPETVAEEVSEVVDEQPEVEQVSEGVEPFSPEKLQAMAGEVAPTQSEEVNTEESEFQAPPAYQETAATDVVEPTATEDSHESEESSSENADDSAGTESAAEPLTSGSADESAATDDSQEESNWPPEPMN